jgi:hypothetical protein
MPSCDASNPTAASPKVTNAAITTTTVFVASSSRSRAPLRNRSSKHVVPECLYDKAQSRLFSEFGHALRRTAGHGSRLTHLLRLAESHNGRSRASVVWAKARAASMVMKFRCRPGRRRRPSTGWVERKNHLRASDELLSAIALCAKDNGSTTSLSTSRRTVSSPVSSHRIISVRS